MSNKRNKKGEFDLNIKQYVYKPVDLAIEEHILSFDVLNSTAEQARELVAWLQLEIKAIRNIP